MRVNHSSVAQGNRTTDKDNRIQLGRPRLAFARSFHRESSIALVQATREVAGFPIDKDPGDLMQR